VRSQDGQHLADAAGLQAQHAVQEDRTVQVGLGEAVEFGGQLGVVGRLFDAQRVERRLQVTAHTVAADQHQGADRVVGGGADLVGRDAAAARAERRRRQARRASSDRAWGPATAVEHGLGFGRLW
jgi:G3E family GTPase